MSRKKEKSLWERTLGRTLLEVEIVEKPKRKRLTKADKEKILKRQNYKCAGKNCSINFRETEVPISWDHKKPLALGGTNSLKNYQALCPNCHAIKTRKDRSKIAKAKEKEKKRTLFGFGTPIRIKKPKG